MGRKSASPEERAAALERARRATERRRKFAPYIEPVAVKPQTPGACDFCCSPIAPGRRFCPGGACARAYRQVAKVRGASLYDLLMAWRRSRHTPGAGKGLMSQIARRLDEFADRDRAFRAATGKGAP